MMHCFQRLPVRKLKVYPSRDNRDGCLANTEHGAVHGMESQQPIGHSHRQLVKKGHDRIVRDLLSCLHIAQCEA